MGETFFGIIIITIFLLIGFYNLLIAILGKFPKFQASTVGTLKVIQMRKNVQGKYQTTPIVTDYQYDYIVKGKKYSYRNSIKAHKRKLYQKVTMVYVKWFPRYAYPEKFTAFTQWIVGVLMLFMGILFIFALILI